jgi:hypothetical protein
MQFLLKGGENMNKTQVYVYLLLGILCTGFTFCVDDDTDSQYSNTRSETPAQAVELTEAEDQGLVQVEASGNGLEWLKIVLDSLSDLPLEVTIEPGTVFEAHSAGTQSMVIRERKVVYLNPRERTVLKLLAACADMMLDTPDDIDGFTLKRTPTQEDLVKLLNLPDFLEESFRVQQFAIWTITDNPSRSGYVGLGYDEYGSGPTMRKCVEYGPYLKRLEYLFTTIKRCVR